LRLLTLQTQLLTFTLPPCANVLLTEYVNDSQRPPPVPPAVAAGAQMYCSQNT